MVQNQEWNLAPIDAEALADTLADTVPEPGARNQNSSIKSPEISCHVKRAFPKSNHYIQMSTHHIQMLMGLRIL